MVELLLPSISMIFSIIAILISIRQYLLSKKTQILRPHSDRLCEALEFWIKSYAFLPKVLDPADIPEDLTSIALPAEKLYLKHPSLPFAMRHFETGYEKEYLEQKELETQIVKHNEQIEEFFMQLCNKAKQELKLSESPIEKDHAYYKE